MTESRQVRRQRERQINKQVASYERTVTSVLGKNQRVNHKAQLVGQDELAALRETEQEISATKGQFGKACNRTACQKPDSATWFNTSTRSFYCRNCAEGHHSINFWARKDAGFPICFEVESVEEAGKLLFGKDYVRVGDALVEVA